MRKPLVERFWAKVEKTDTCWIWRWSRHERGYGQIKQAGRTRRAHRVSYAMAYGSIPEGVQVHHVCDNPPCVRPDHLRVGTNAENMADCVSKGRIARGEAIGVSRLTECIVREIRGGYESGENMGSLAYRYGIDPSHVHLIVRRKVWTHV